MKMNEDKKMCIMDEIEMKMKKMWDILIAIQFKNVIRCHFKLFYVVYGEGDDVVVYESSAHLFSALTASSSSGEKSFWILNLLRISSGVLPFIILATLAHVKSNNGLISI